MGWLLRNTAPPPPTHVCEPPTVWSPPAGYHVPDGLAGDVWQCDEHECGELWEIVRDRHGDLQWRQSEGTFTTLLLYRRVRKAQERAERDRRKGQRR